MNRASAIAAASLLAWVAISGSALAAPASASAAPNILPSESMGVSKAPPPQPINWDKVTQEATDLLSRYIQLNTTNPPGNEIEAARMLREKFLTDGIPATTWEPQHGRGIVAARLRGIGKHTKSIILLSHMDVVPANPKEGEVAPFSGAVKDGKIWGRGSIDDKGPGVIELMAMLAIKRAGILLDRDVLFVATGDEEAGGKNGAGWFVDHEANVFSDAGYLINEGGGIRALSDAKRKVYVVSVTEKTPLWLRLTASGPAGHASDPPAETAVTRLVRALDKLSEYKTPIHVIGPVNDYYHTMTELDHGPRQLLDLAAALKDPAYLKEFLDDPGQNARVRDTITPTVLSASDKTNVISETAYSAARHGRTRGPRAARRGKWRRPARRGQPWARRVPRGAAWIGQPALRSAFTLPRGDHPRVRSRTRRLPARSVRPGRPQPGKRPGTAGSGPRPGHGPLPGRPGLRGAAAAPTAG